MNLLEQINELLNQGVPMYEIVLGIGAISGIVTLFMIIIVLNWRTL